MRNSPKILPHPLLERESVRTRPQERTGKDVLEMGGAAVAIPRKPFQTAAGEWTRWNDRMAPRFRT